MSEREAALDQSAITPTQMLRERLTAFRFMDDSPSLRQSPRTQARFKTQDEDTVLPTLTPHTLKPSTTRKRPHTHQADDVKSELAVDSGSKKQRTASSKNPRQKIGFAPPEKYAHLRELNDHLGEGADTLDVMFCGINPGQMSATLGHHFAHRTNHFWRCLHGGQLTDRLLSPTEDHSLPDSYQLGLTNLVERPSAQAAELSKAEFTAGVPALLWKITQKRPRIVCFVGKGIWDSFVSAAAPPTSTPVASASAPSNATTEPEVGQAASVRSADISAFVDASISGADATAPAPIVPSSAMVANVKSAKGRPEPKVKTGRAATQKPRPAPFVYDIQPYKVVHAAASARVRETLFFVVVSTSGLVASHQLPDKIKQFALLKRRLDECKNGTLNTSAMTVIPVLEAAGSVS